MKLSDVARVLQSVMPTTNRPVALWSQPGVGKSSVVRQVADSLGISLVTVMGSQFDPVDLRGIPSVKNGKTTWCPPDFLPTSGSGILFLDEMGQADQDVQKIFAQLCLDRRLGEYVMPEGWKVVAASNRVEDRAGVGRVLTHLLNRFIHIDVDVSTQDWQDWAVAAGVVPEVRAFINYRPNLLMQFDPTTNARSFASPRSWHMVSDQMPHLPNDLLFDVVKGTVGEGPASEFVGFLQLYQKLPDIDAVIANPNSFQVPKEPAVLYALIGAIGERIRSKKAPPASLAKVGMRLPDEFGMVAMRDALALDKTLVADKTIQSWIAQARAKGLFKGV